MPKLTNLDVEFVSLVDRAAVRDCADPTQPQRFLVTKGEVPLWKRDGGETPTGGTMTPEESAAALQKAESERDSAIAKAEQLEQRITELEKAKPEPKDEPEPAKIDKAQLDPAVREALEKAEAAQRDADTRIAKAESDARESAEIAKAERDTRVAREFVVKAQEIPHVAGSPDEFGPVLKAAAEKLSKEEFEALQTRLRAANEQIARGELFKQYGGDGDGNPASDEAASVAARKAQEIRKSDPSLSEFEAQRRALRDPDVRAALIAQR